MDEFWQQSLHYFANNQHNHVIEWVLTHASVLSNLVVFIAKVTMLIAEKFVQLPNFKVFILLI